ncbi:uncharacterized protein LOC116344179 [Contarinia nasturtii]|uniref:uncharacterized protein LOC116344179 n=1 Tax=Contarinia nasturtii TaxID=265458 RepID=UPI0012D4A639|nr:uncharacterized protein LOC116344179 [Contarinia nasturtii]
MKFAALLFCGITLSLFGSGFSMFPEHLIMGEIQKEMQNIGMLSQAIISFSDWFDFRSVEQIQAWLKGNHPATAKKLLSSVVSKVDEVLKENMKIQQEVISDSRRNVQANGNSAQVMASLNQAFMSGKLMGKSTDTLIKVLKIVGEMHLDVLDLGVKVKSFEQNYTDKMFNNSLDGVRKGLFQIGKATATKTAPSEKEIQNGSALIQQTILTPLTNYLNNKEKKAVMQQYVKHIQEESKTLKGLLEAKRDQIMALL